MKYFYELTISSSPHVHSPVTTQTIMRDVLIALAPALIGSIVMIDTPINAISATIAKILKRYLFFSTSIIPFISCS